MRGCRSLWSTRLLLPFSKKYLKGLLAPLSALELQEARIYWTRKSPFLKVTLIRARSALVEPVVGVDT